MALIQNKHVPLPFYVSGKNFLRFFGQMTFIWFNGIHFIFAKQKIERVGAEPQAWSRNFCFNRHDLRFRCDFGQLPFWPAVILPGGKTWEVLDDN